MKKFNVMIPIGGLGQRFKDDNYYKPKPLIKVLGKEILFWVLDNINYTYVETLILVYTEELSNFNFKSIVKRRFPDVNIKFIQLKDNTRGAIETVSLGLSSIDVDVSIPFITLDCDTFYKEDIFKKLDENSNEILYFEDKREDPLFSYISTEKGRVTDIAEKIRISSKANTGAYKFENVSVFLKYAKIVLENKVLENKELYISNIYKLMLNDNIKIKAVRVFDFFCLGTPSQVRMFSMNFKDYSPKRICFDLDNTLCTYPKETGNYKTVEPLDKNIEILKFLKQKGHVIIIYTARRMKTSKGNIGKLMQQVGKITIDWLEEHNIPYDELYFGKPYADLYVDDLAINPYVNDIQREIGFYIPEISPRDHNKIIVEDNTIIKKSSSNEIKGEIFWYKNVPKDLKKFIPRLIRFKDKYLEIEKINGVTYSYLFVNDELKKEHLLKLLETIDFIHNIKKKPDDVDIYFNYLEKTKLRYSNYNYEKFSNSSEIYNTLLNYSEKYKKNNEGRIGIIHGDPVFTNVILTENGRNIKLIDMKGSSGNVLTLFGDIFYDYAKIYQSLNGYDHILHDKTLKSYKLREVFEEWFIVKYGVKKLHYLRYLTCNLIFSLIPLHNNSKCIKYYNLIKEILKEEK